MRSLALIPFAVLLLSCGDNGGDDGDDEPYDTFQACFDDHHKVETFDVQTSIKICCIDHPIGGQDKNIVCGETSADCQTFVNANLADADANATDITMACDGYITDRNQ